MSDESATHRLKVPREVAIELHGELPTPINIAIAHLLIVQLEAHTETSSGRVVAKGGAGEGAWWWLLVSRRLLSLARGGEDAAGKVVDGGMAGGGKAIGGWGDRLLGQLKTAHARRGVTAALGGSSRGSWEELEATEEEAVLEGLVQGEGGLLEGERLPGQKALQWSYNRWG